MLKNIALRSLKNVYIFVLRADKPTTFEPKLAGEWQAFGGGLVGASLIQFF